MNVKTTVTCLFSFLQLSCATYIDANNSGLDNLYASRWSSPSQPDQYLSIENVVAELKDSDVVFFGELHGHPGIHLAEMQVLQRLHQVNPEISLSLEQFERDTQDVLDQYLQREIGETYMLDRARAWDNYKSSYRPLVEFARNAEIPVIAANAPKQMVVCVGRHGLDVLESYSAMEREGVASRVDTSAGDYRDKFMALMQHDSAHNAHGDKASSKVIQKALDSQFEAQALRDSTMAESIARHINTHEGRKVLHINGYFHSSDFLGTVERLRKQMPKLKISVIHPLTEGEFNDFNGDEVPGTFLITVKSLPTQFVQEKHQKAWMNKIVKSRMKSRKDCPAI